MCIFTGNLIESGNSNNNNIKFKNGNTYTYNIEDKAVYLNNNIKLKVVGNNLRILRKNQNNNYFPRHLED